MGGGGAVFCFASHTRAAIKQKSTPSKLRHNFYPTDVTNLTAVPLANMRMLFMRMPTLRRRSSNRCLAFHQFLPSVVGSTQALEIALVTTVVRVRLHRQAFESFAHVLPELSSETSKRNLYLWERLRKSLTNSRFALSTAEGMVADFTPALTNVRRDLQFFVTTPYCPSLWPLLSCSRHCDGHATYTLARDMYRGSTTRTTVIIYALWP